MRYSNVAVIDKNVVKNAILGALFFILFVVLVKGPLITYGAPTELPDTLTTGMGNILTDRVSLFDNLYGDEIIALVPYYATDSTGIRYTVYCLEKDKGWIPGETITRNETPLDDGYVYILQNGYPKVSLTGNDENDEYLTQIAVWWYQDLYEGITEILSVNRRLEKVYVYATMSSDVDTSNTHYLGLVAKAQSLANQMSAATSFVDPEILSIPGETLAKFMQDEPRLKEYQHRLEQITKKRPHTLPASEEKIIAAAGDAMGTSANTFNVLTNSDMEYGYVQDEDGEMVQLSDGLYSLLIQSQDRNVRKNAFDVMYASYGQFENSLASTLSGEVKAHNFNAQVHKYNSAREAALSENGVPTAVYDTLVKEVNSHLNLLHRYVGLRKKIL